MLLLDTHVLVWLDEGSPRLGRVARSKIDQALVAENLAVATISFWEIAMLSEKKRLTLQLELAAWRSELLQAGLAEIPLDGGTALLAGQLTDFHGDPADRMIVASALARQMTLVTADEKLLTWPHLPQKLDARR